jgi:hypothetical protein
MNHDDAIEWLAHVNSAFCYPKQFHEIDLSLPYFYVKMIDLKYKIDIFNYKMHDNAPRMPYVTSYLENYVLPFVKNDPTGYYSIQLHDTYTYLDDNKCYDGVLTFGKSKTDDRPVMIPDCYFMGNWGDKYKNIVDNYSWNDKYNKAIFIGSTTGARNPLLNERINTCLWALDKPEIDCWISNIVQMNVIDALPRVQRVMHAAMTFDEQMKYKYMLLIDGNTNKWTCDSFYTNSLSLMMPSRDMLWYYPRISEGCHYVEVTLETLVNKINYYNSNEAEARLIAKNGNILAKQMFNNETCQKYMIALFNAIADNK